MFYFVIYVLNLDKFNSLGIIKNAKIESKELISKTIIDLEKLLAKSDYDKSDIVQTLQLYISDFQHIETGNSLDQKM